MIRWLGLDIGGANLKIADPNGYARSESFPLWKQPDELHAAIARLLVEAPEFDAIAVTMTGELADCYATREEGVCRILEQLTSVYPSQLVRVYALGDRWKTATQAARNPWEVAASNWFALTSFCRRWVEPQGFAILVDIGSTTCDVIPLSSTAVLTDAKTDNDRLLKSQLVYTGVERTPLCALASTLPFRGQMCPVMAEFFATTLDAYLWLGEIEERSDSLVTADGRPATKAAAAFRLARMIGEEGSALSIEEIDELAFAVAESQASLLAKSIDAQRLQLHGKCNSVIISGHGEFLLDAALHQLGWSPLRIRANERLGTESSRCLPAYAVAVLGQETFQDWQQLIAT
ncbi:MAG: hydantoinase/oxoprolinase family protein [Pirellulales bacterium]